MEWKIEMKYLIEWDLNVMKNDSNKVWEMDSRLRQIIHMCPNDSGHWEYLIDLKIKMFTLRMT